MKALFLEASAQAFDPVQDPLQLKLAKSAYARPQAGHSFCIVTGSAEQGNAPERIGVPRCVCRMSNGDSDRGLKRFNGEDDDAGKQLRKWKQWAEAGRWPA